MIEKPTIVNFREQVRQLKTQACKDAKELFVGRPVILATGIEPELKSLSLKELCGLTLSCAKGQRNFSIVFKILTPENIRVNSSFGELLTLESRNEFHLAISLSYGYFQILNFIEYRTGDDNYKPIRITYEDNISIYDPTPETDLIDVYLRNIVKSLGITGFSRKTTDHFSMLKWGYRYDTTLKDVDKENNIKVDSVLSDTKNELNNFLKHGNSNFISNGCSTNVCDPLF
jgi:hypothetical protein